MKKAIIIKKAAIKIVKRYKEAAAEKIVTAPQMSGGGAEAEINVESAMAGTISGWISERRSNRQAEEVFAMSRISAWKNNRELLSQS